MRILSYHPSPHIEAQNVQRLHVPRISKGWTYRIRAKNRVVGVFQTVDLFPKSCWQSRASYLLKKQYPSKNTLLWPRSTCPRWHTKWNRSVFSCRIAGRHNQNTWGVWVWASRVQKWSSAQVAQHVSSTTDFKALETRRINGRDDSAWHQRSDLHEAHQQRPHRSQIHPWSATSFNPSE